MKAPYVNSASVVAGAPCVSWFTIPAIFASPPVAVQVAEPTYPAEMTLSCTEVSEAPGATAVDGMLYDVPLKVQATLVDCVPTFAMEKPVKILKLRSMISGRLTLLVAFALLIAS